MSVSIIVPESLCWIGFLWLTYVYIGYPLCLLALQLRRKVRPVIAESYLPKVSVVIAARNEENDIGCKLTGTLTWDYPPDKLEVLVASDASDDRTDDIIRSIRDPRLIFQRMESRCGKNLALNRLISNASGELLFFTDANSQIEAGCLRRIVRHFADERVGCVTGEMKYVTEDADPAMSAGERAYWGYESLVKRLESNIGSVLVCVGSVFCCRRALFTPVQPEVANDMEIPIRIGDGGHYVCYEPSARSIEKTSATPWEEYVRRKRICAQGILGMWKLREKLRGLRRWQFVSRKLLRWLALVPMGMLFVAALVLVSHTFFRALVILQLAGYGAALVGFAFSMRGRTGGRIFSVPFYIVLLNVAALAGLVEACRGKRFAVWEITRGVKEIKPAAEKTLYTQCESGELR